MPCLLLRVERARLLTGLRYKEKRFSVVKCKRKGNDIFKSVDNTLDVYIGRCSSDATTAAIESYISESANITPTMCSCISREDSSFKVTVLADHRDALLDPLLWPEGIIVRKYYKSNHNGESRQ